MKLSVTFKDPDVVSEAIWNKKLFLVNHYVKVMGLTEAGAEAEAEARLEGLEKLITEYVEWGEYLTVEFDDEARTAKVVGVGARGAD